jgi:hypothetical protein
VDTSAELTRTAVPPGGMRLSPGEPGPSNNRSTDAHHLRDAYIPNCGTYVPPAEAIVFKLEQPVGVVEGAGWRRYSLCSVCGLAKREALCAHRNRSIAMIEASSRK